jgi:hypothetical protein
MLDQLTSHAAPGVVGAVFVLVTMSSRQRSYVAQLRLAGWMSFCDSGVVPPPTEYLAAAAVRELHGR